MQTPWLRFRKLLSRVKDLAAEESSPSRLAFAFGVGAFTGPTPAIGLQTVSAIALAWLLRLNRVAAVVGTNVGNPWLKGFFLWLDVRVGAWLMGRALPPFPRHATLDEIWIWIEPRIVPAFVGSIPVGLATGAVCGGVLYLLALGWSKRAALRRGGNPSPPSA